jgi:hypothetical protein
LRHGLSPGYRSHTLAAALAELDGVVVEDRLAMAHRHELRQFIGSTFASVWSLELLLFLKRNGDRAWPRSELVTALRGSDLLVARSLDALLAAGLIDIDEQGAAQYRVATRDLEAWMEAVEAEYSRSPDAVRRTIINGTEGDLTAFANAFKWRTER